MAALLRALPAHRARLSPAQQTDDCLTELRWLYDRHTAEEARHDQPSAVILDSRTVQSSSGDGAKRRKGSKVHAAVDTLGHVVAMRVTAANDQDRAQVGALAADVQASTGKAVELAYVDQGYTGASTAEAAQAMGSSST